MDEPSTNYSRLNSLRYGATELVLKSDGALFPSSFKRFRRSTKILGFLVNAAIRAPKLLIAVLLLALVALASAMSYTAYLVVGVVAEYAGTGRLMAGFLLGALFARFPWVSAGKFRTVGLLPKQARLPVMIALLALCLLSFLRRGELVPMLFLGFAATFMLAYRRMRQMLINRAMSSLFQSPAGPDYAKSADDTVIDVEFREKKD